MISGILFSLHPHALNSNRIGFIPEITLIETQQIAFWAAWRRLDAIWVKLLVGSEKDRGSWKKFYYSTAAKQPIRACDHK